MFELDHRLELDCLQVGDFPLCRLLLMNDAQYPWFILVPRREGISEVFQLHDTDQQALWQEAASLAEKLKDTFSADKMNIATLGNMVPQLHVHVIVRRKEDAAWPAPVWGKHAPRPYQAAEILAVREKLRLTLTQDFVFFEDQA
ncbi:Diadenosine tetraphosphate (Ap4A) hydrolase [Atopomonas hussainii]|uniref:Diadenosine tetraphosphate (Ap4A) hydrolase n=1 Tax=Atopomonas hussainii TaxID=1429083 RepID=A0A1H7SLX1_9GAMM|nr:HIT domain-containing protein [Atopomonas hussainii]SEL73379.1 Diadenosine tetraphosphate (Ap4A) hydrolase [Atopomonas hussainii]